MDVLREVNDARTVLDLIEENETAVKDLLAQGQEIDREYERQQAALKIRAGELRERRVHLKLELNRITSNTSTHLDPGND